MGYNVESMKIYRINKACRSAVNSVIMEMRNKITLPFVCPITGETIEDKHLIHVDHYDKTFAELFHEWLKGKDIDELYNKTLKQKGDKRLGTFFDDDELNRDFLEFHNNNTHLRLVSAKANLTILRK